MFRRSVLEKVGPFNPYLCSDEEPELCLRIRHAGYRIFRLSQPMAYEYTDCKELVATKIARWRRQLYLGAGQNLRYHLGDEIFWPYLKERGFGLMPLVGLLVGGAASAWYVLSGQALWLGMWATLAVLFVMADAWRKRSLYRTCVSIVERLCIAEGMVRGFLHKAPEPQRYPSRFDVIRRIHNQEN
jgi:hypothetical protein